MLLCKQKRKYEHINIILIILININIVVNKEKKKEAKSAATIASTGATRTTISLPSIISRLTAQSKDIISTKFKTKILDHIIS